MNKIQSANITTNDDRWVSSYSPTLTFHATTRAQSRGVTQEVAQLAAAFGKRQRAKGGKFLRTVGNREIKRIQRDGSLPPTMIDRLRGLRVITFENGDTRTVVTVLGKSRG